MSELLLTDEEIARTLEGITMFKGYNLSDAITPSDRAIAEAQLAKDEARFQELLKHRSPELRGELETVLKRLFFEYGVKVSVPLGLLTPDREAYVRPIWVNQLLLFYPDEEAIRRLRREPVTDKIFNLQDLDQAKREERERLVKIMEMNQRVTSDPGILVYFNMSQWQALKKGE